MAALLKKPAGTTPTRRLLSTGTAPQKTVRLKGSNGQAIQAKAPAAFAKRTAPGAKPEEKPAKEEKPAETVAESQPETKEAEMPQQAPVAETSSEARNQETPVAETQPVEDAAPAVEQVGPEEKQEEKTEEKPEEKESGDAPAPESAPEEESPSEPGDAQGVQQTDEAQRMAEEEYARQMEEYNRQMEEYNRQMEEYQRQQALMQQQAETTAPTEASPEGSPVEEVNPAQEGRQAGEEIAVKPIAKATVAGGLKVAGRAKPVGAAGHLVVGGVKKGAGATATGRPKAAAAPVNPVGSASSAEPNASVAPEETPAGEAETPQGPALTEVDEKYVTMLQQTAERRPMYKSKGFMIACVALLVFAGICGYFIVKQNAENAAMRERNARIMGILGRAREINKLQIESLADAKKKNVDIKCSKKEAEFLMDVIVNPEMKDDSGRPMFGNHPEGVANLACLLVGIASEADDGIGTMVFNRLHKDVRKINPATYRWLVQRLALADIKDINKKLHDLATQVAKIKVKSFSKRDEILSYIWEAMGLRVTEKDIEPICTLLKDPETSNKLAGTLSVCLRNIVERMEDRAKRSEIGDKIFEQTPEDKRGLLMATLAESCSPKALDYYKQRAITPANWKTDRNFFANYGSDDIMPYLVGEMKSAAGEDPKLQKLVDEIIASVVRKDRDRQPADAQKLVKMVYDKLDVDTSAWEEINEKTDKDSAMFVGEDSPEYEKLMKQRADIEGCRKQKLEFIRVLSGMKDWPWVVQYLERFKKEPDAQIASAASHAHDKVIENRENENEVQQNYNRRTKE